MSDDADHAEDADHAPLRTVIATSEADLIPVIKSVLRGAGIEYATDGEAMMNLFPSDLLGPTLHRSRGELRFMVREVDFEAAKLLFEEHPDVPTDEASAEPQDDSGGEL